MWKYLYQTLSSMDRWFFNPSNPAYRDPPFHQKDMADLNVTPCEETVSRATREEYFEAIRRKITAYPQALTDDVLSQMPEGCNRTRFRLILGQFRHWHRHMGMMIGLIIQDTGRWPYGLNMDAPYPDTPMPNNY